MSERALRRVASAVVLVVAGVALAGGGYALSERGGASDEPRLEERTESESIATTGMDPEANRAVERALDAWCSSDDVTPPDQVPYSTANGHGTAGVLLLFPAGTLPAEGKTGFCAGQ